MHLSVNNLDLTFKSTSTISYWTHPGARGRETYFVYLATKVAILINLVIIVA